MGFSSALEIGIWVRVRDPEKGRDFESGAVKGFNLVLEIWTEMG